MMIPGMMKGFLKWVFAHYLFLEGCFFVSLWFILRLKRTESSL